MKKLKVGTKEFAKAGADARWAKRHETIIALSRYVDKAYLDRMMQWKTEHLERLLEAYRK